MSLSSSGEQAQLESELREARNQLGASIQGLTDEQMTRLGAVGEWSVKDVLSHATSWEEIALPDLVRLARGEKPALPSIGELESADFDRPNSVIMAQRRNLPLDQVLRALDIVHRDFIEAARRLPASALGEGQFGRGLLQITAEHDREHALNVLAWRQREGI